MCCKRLFPETEQILISESLEWWQTIASLLLSAERKILRQQPLWGIELYSDSTVNSFVWQNRQLVYTYGNWWLELTVLSMLLPGLDLLNLHCVCLSRMDWKFSCSNTSDITVTKGGNRWSLPEEVRAINLRFHFVHFRIYIMRSCIIW